MTKRIGMAAVALAAGVTAISAVEAKGAGLLIADGGLGGSMEIKEHVVHVAVNNGIVTTTVDEVFLNHESRSVEGLYTFPVPKGASVSNFSMWIGGKEMVGEVVEKKRAREIYNSYKQQRRDPGLLEQVDYRTFEMRVFPIPAKGEQHVRVTYSQELDFDHNTATYVYPLATNTRGGVDSKVTGKFAMTVDAKSEIPITEMASPSHPKDFVVATHSPAYRQASLENKGGDLAKDIVLNFQMERPHTGVDLITSKSSGEDGYFQLTLTAGEELAKMEEPMDYVFVLDISGSMNDDRKLAMSTESLGDFMKLLGPKDRFEVITFNVQPNALFGKLESAGEQSMASADKFLASQEARGGTVLNRAMGMAYKYADKERKLNVVILSDGMTDPNENGELASLIANRPRDSRVFAIGVGNDVNRPLLSRIAEGSGGLAAFLSPSDNLKRQAEGFRRKLMRPVASDVEIKLSGIDAYDLEPAKLPNLYYGQPVRLYGRYKGAGPGEVKVVGKIQGHPLEQAVSMDFPKQDDSSPQIERMWANKRIDDLLKKADDAGDREPVIPEVIRLGEGYSIMSEYTSFLVLENDAEYGRWKIERKNALRVSRDRAAEEAVAKKLEGLRNQSAEALGPSGVELIKTETSSASAPDGVAPAMPVPSGGTPGAAPQPMPSSPHSRNFSFGGGGGGGGALDPWSVGGACGLVAGGVLLRRRVTKTVRGL